ncbi:MAG TPA: EamA family transporter [Mycobacterium sp.]|nr:EamA family transporter [Mycobacterium sp.]
MNIVAARPQSDSVYFGPLCGVAAMVSIQAGAAVSTHLFAQLGPLATASLRLVCAAVIILVLVRPRLPTRESLRTILLYGLISATMTLLYFLAVSRIPLGVASCLEFLGPLVVALLGARGRGYLVPLIALTGVVLITNPFTGGELDPLGVIFGVGAGAMLGCYVVITSRLGETEGFDGLAWSITAAALVSLPVGVATAKQSPSFGAIGLSLVAAILLPLLPYALELLALRRMSSGSFAILLSLEPFIAVLIGWLLLTQALSTAQYVGIALVVVSNVAVLTTTRRGQDEATDTS